MLQSSALPVRHDPYKSYRLKLTYDQQAYIGSMLTGLQSTGEVVKHRSGGDPSTTTKSPGRNKYDAVTVIRGITFDQSFASWASSVWSFGSSLGGEVSLANFRKDLYLEFYNEAGQAVVSFKLSNGLVLEKQILHNPRTIQHNMNFRPGLTLREKLAALFQEALDRSKGSG